MALLVEMGWGGLVTYPNTIQWTDVSRKVDTARGVTITRGASDEVSETQPGTATLTLDNTDGRFTPGNSSSPYWPYVRRNTPIRIAVCLMPTTSGSAPYPLAQLGDDFDDDVLSTTLWPGSYGGVLETNGVARVPVSTVADAGLQSARVWKLTGSQLAAKLVTVPKANGSTNAAASMWVTSTTAGTRIGWRYDALTGLLAAMNQTGFSDASPTNLTYNVVDFAWLRVREASGTVYWESSPDGRDWTTRRTMATPSWVGSQTQAVEFPATRTGGTNDFIEWDLINATVKGRFCGVVNEFPVDWEGLSSTVTISCTDLFKQLNKLPVLKSMLTEEIVVSFPAAYYPLTESTESATAGDLSGNGLSSMSVAQAGAGGTLTLGTDTGPDATGDSTPTFSPASATAGKYLTVDLGAATQQLLTPNPVTVEAWFKTTTTGRAILSLYSPDRQNVQLLSLSASGAMQIEWTATGATTLTVETVAGTSGLADGKWHHVVWDQTPSGVVCVDGVNVDPSIPVAAGIDQRTLEVGGYRGTRLWSGSVAHVALYARPYMAGQIKDHYNAGATAYDGETADIRINRFTRYAGIVSTIIMGATHDPIASQGAGGSGVVARMREVESTESGRLYASRDWYYMTYQSRDVRYNPAPGLEAFQVAYADVETRGVSLADDDQKLVNDVTGTRPGGATQRVTAPSSILAFGTYPQELNILKTSDNSVLDAAYWLVSRYANPAPELREVPIEAYTMPSYAAVLDADISSYFSVTGMPSQAPAPSVRVTVEGYTETIRERSHLISFHTSASITDSVWVMDDPAYSILDSTTRLAY
ncbi:LamG-like jellyroll fold domain-containing protein [Streptomyces griseoluteus]|uniref:LamG-like jellyroll fold domain-containing protein n=1 Tax=Streptomyces griseoluteus TaxID=29306 RepID=UPI003822807A